MPPDAAIPHHVDVRGVRVPTLVYGTAWKEDRTAPLVRAALDTGFRGLDTANQRRHYHEAGVGEALAGAITDDVVAREDVFVQTKFTYVRGQDHRLPYNPEAPIPEQVTQSFESSLSHLGLDHVDAYLLHGPWGFPGLSSQDVDAWGAMEALHREGRARLIGISNVTPAQLEALHEVASVTPAIVQNRTFTRPEADLAVRTFCREHDIAYQGFSLLTAVPQLLTHPVVRAAAARTGRMPAAMVLRFCLEQDMVVLTGTTNPEHMAEDLAARDVALTGEEAAAFARLVPVPSR